MKNALKVILIIVLTIATIIGVLFSLYNFAFITKTKLQKIKNHNDKYTVELIRKDALFRKYFVFVNDKRVYCSTKFESRNDIPFREALTWDSTGSVVIFEIAGQRIFGYDVENNRQLSNEQLLTIPLQPKPGLWEYALFFEWPGIGQVHPPARPIQESPK